MSVIEPLVHVRVAALLVVQDTTLLSPSTTLLGETVITQLAFDTAGVVGVVGVVDVVHPPPTTALLLEELLELPPLAPLPAPAAAAPPQPTTASLLEELLEVPPPEEPPPVPVAAALPPPTTAALLLEELLAPLFVFVLLEPVPEAALVPVLEEVL